MTLHLRPSSSEDSGTVTYRRKPDGNVDPAGETGWFLQRERERRGKTLADAALETHISAKYLHAIEMGVLQDLPAQSYVLGYIRVYADFLGLETDPLLEQYKNLLRRDSGVEYGGGRDLMKTVALVAASLVFLAVMTGVIWYTVPGLLSSMTDGFAEASLEEQPQSGAPATAQPDNIETGTVEPTDQVDPQQEAAEAIDEILDDAVPTVVVRQEGFDDSEEAAPDTGLQEGDLATPAMPPDEEGLDEAGRLTEFIRQHVTEADEGAAEQGANGIVYGAENENARIVLTAIRAVWIRVEDADGRILITRTLQAGDSYRVPDIEGLVLIARDGGALDYSIDGLNRGTVGAPGEIVVGRSLNVGAIDRADG